LAVPVLCSEWAITAEHWQSQWHPRDFSGGRFGQLTGQFAIGSHAKPSPDGQPNQLNPMRLHSATFKGHTNIGFDPRHDISPGK
jgi:hypothetical protein